MRSLGEFFGHIARAVRTDPATPRRQIVQTKTSEERLDTPAGPVTLRRTVIDEVVLPAGGQSATRDASHPR